MGFPWLICTCHEFRPHGGKVNEGFLSEHPQGIAGPNICPLQVYYPTCL